MVSSSCCIPESGILLLGIVLGIALIMLISSSTSSCFSTDPRPLETERDCSDVGLVWRPGLFGDTDSFAIKSGEVFLESATGGSSGCVIGSIGSIVVGFGLDFLLHITAEMVRTMAKRTPNTTNTMTRMSGVPRKPVDWCGEEMAQPSHD